MKRRPHLLIVALLALVLVVPSARAGSDEPCLDPHPCGYTWDGPTTPVKPGPITPLSVPSFDGTVLDGWLRMPNLPAGVRAPVVLMSGPYYGQLEGRGDNPAVREIRRVPVDQLVRAGYAVALFSVRGTGSSQGCFEFFGAREQRDQAFLVEWLARQPWSNGRVGMIGLSYDGTTPVQAAIQNPAGLKTVVIAGTVTDAYQFSHTPQGALMTGASAYLAAVSAAVSLAPPAAGDVTGGAVDPGHGTVRHLGNLPTRACEEVVRAMTYMYGDYALDQRDASYWSTRNFLPRLRKAKAAFFVTHGFQDRYRSGHAFQEDVLWQTLQRAPKRMLEGQWGHEYPDTNNVHPGWELSDWPQTLIAWLDYWLKGWGREAPGLGTVRYQASDRSWNNTTSWPPTGRKDEALRLSAAGLTAAPADGDVSFLSVPPPPATPTDPYAPVGWVSPCPDATPIPIRQVFSSKPVTSRTLVAGNPVLSLSLASTQPAGTVAVQMYDVGPKFDCADPGLKDARILTQGAADLRYHTGGYRAVPFSTTKNTQVRVDLASIAEVLEPGHRVLIVLSFGDPSEYNGQPFVPPTLTVRAGAGVEASRLVLPVVSGGFGGSTAHFPLPARPFLPKGTSG